MAAEVSPSTHWSGTGKLRGGPWGIWLFITIIRVFGLWAAYAFAVPCSIYFSFASPDVAATMDYHRRVFGNVPWWKRRWLVFNHFFSFGCALIDRTAILAGRSQYTFAFDGEQHVRDVLKEGHGVLLLTAHLGNWEAAGQLLARLDVPVNVTGFDNETTQMRNLLNRSSDVKFRLIPLTGSPTDTLPLVAALRRGEIVAMLGDRAYGSPSTPLPFLGGTAWFPIGAYVMAAIAGAPLVHVFSLREPGGHYHFFGFPPERPHMPPRNQRDAYLSACAARFVTNMESVLRRDPLQWYNFYPFWKNSGTPKIAPDEIRFGEINRIMSLAIENLLPHRAPMRWLDELTECTETRARGTVRFDDKHFAVADGRVLETSLVECIAQTIAAAQSQRARMPGGSGKPSVGMLAAVANFKIHSPPPLEKFLEIEIRELKKFGPMLLVAGKISHEGQLIAEGELTVYA